MAIPKEIIGRLNAKEPEVAPADLKTLIASLEELKQLSKGKFFEKFKVYLNSRKLPPGIQQLIIQADAGLAAENLADISPNNQAQFCRDRDNDEHRLTLFKRLHGFKEINPLVIYPFIKHPKTTPLMAGLVLNRMETSEEAVEIVKRFPDCVKYSTHPLDLPDEAKAIVLKHDPELKIYLAGVLPEVKPTQKEVKEQTSTPKEAPEAKPNPSPNPEIKRGRGRPPKPKEAPLPKIDETVVLDGPPDEPEPEPKAVKIPSQLPEPSQTPGKRRGRPPKIRQPESELAPEPEPTSEINVIPQAVTPDSDSVIELPEIEPETEAQPVTSEPEEEDEDDEDFIIPDFDNELGTSIDDDDVAEEVEEEEEEDDEEIEQRLNNAPPAEVEDEQEPDSDDLVEVDEELTDAFDEEEPEMIEPEENEEDDETMTVDDEDEEAPEPEPEPESESDPEPELEDADLDTEELFGEEEDEKRPTNEPEIEPEDTDPAPDQEDEDETLLVEDDFFNDEELEVEEEESEPEPKTEVPEDKVKIQKKAKQVQNKVNIDDSDNEQRPVADPRPVLEPKQNKNPALEDTPDPDVDDDDTDLFVDEDLTEEDESNDWEGRPLSDSDPEDESVIDRRLAPSHPETIVDEDDIEWIENILGDESEGFGGGGSLEIDPEDAQNVPGKDSRVIHKKNDKIDEDDMVREYEDEEDGKKKINWSEYEAQEDEDENPRANSRPIPQTTSEYDGLIEEPNPAISPLSPDEERDCVNLIKLVARRLLEDERVMKKFKGKISKDELTRYLVKRDAMNRFIDKRKLSGNYKGLPDKFLKLPYQVKIDLVDTAFPAEIIKFKAEASGENLNKIKRALAVELRNPGNAFNQIKTVLRKHGAVLKQAKIDEYRATSGLSQAYYGSFYFKNPSDVYYFYVDKKLYNVEVSRHPID